LSSETKAFGSQKRGKKKGMSPPKKTSTTQGSPLAGSASKKPVEKSSEQSGLESESFIDELNMVPESLRANKKPDYKKVSAMYKKYWETCSIAYIFGAEEKKELPIERLIDAPTKFNVRVKEDTIVNDELPCEHPDKSTK